MGLGAGTFRRKRWPNSYHGSRLRPGVARTRTGSSSRFERNYKRIAGRSQQLLQGMSDHFIPNFPLLDYNSNYWYLTLSNPFFFFYLMNNEGWYLHITESHKTFFLHLRGPTLWLAPLIVKGVTAPFLLEVQFSVLYYSSLGLFDLPCCVYCLRSGM